MDERTGNPSPCYTAKKNVVSDVLLGDPHYLTHYPKRAGCVGCDEGRAVKAKTKSGSATKHHDNAFSIFFDFIGPFTGSVGGKKYIAMFYLQDKNLFYCKGVRDRTDELFLECVVDARVYWQIK